MSFGGTGWINQHHTWTRSADGTWTSTPGSVPADLAAAFPLGSSFVAQQSYDTARLSGSTVHDATTATYQGLSTGFQIQTSGRTITAGTSNTLVVSNNGFANGGGTDYLSMQTRGLTDGVAGFLGYTSVHHSITLFDTDGTALSGTSLPARICLAEWDLMTVHMQIYSPDPSPNLAEYYEIGGWAELDRTIDSDGDGLNDGDERFLRSDPTGTLACLSGCNADSDGDTIRDGAEVSAGTDPCSVDTDGDGLSDRDDPAPLVPATSASLEETVRNTATGVLEIPEGSFSGPNSNARRGRRNALANQLQEVANLIADGMHAAALEKLEHIATLVDGNPSPPDVMGPGPERDALRDEINDLMALVRAAL